MNLSSDNILYIEKNISELSTSKYWKNWILNVIDDISLWIEKIDRSISVVWKWIINYKIFVIWKKSINLEFNIKSSDIKFNLDVLIVWNNWDEVIWNIFVNNLCPLSYSNTKIISLCWNNSVINVSWNVFLNEWAYKSEWFLNQENVYLSENWKITSAPVLNVSCNDVKASHWASFYNLSWINKFYLLSKWISEKDYLNLILAWYYNSFIWDLSNDELCSKYLNYLS